jgi:hypothetical protein
MKQVIITILGVLLIILLILVIINLLGYHFNKNFLNDFVHFNKEQCIESKYPTYYNHSGIAGCIFWMREDYLQKIQSWRNLFKKDEIYCSQKYKK